MTCAATNLQPFEPSGPPLPSACCPGHSLPDAAAHLHHHSLLPNQCCSAVVQLVPAPLPAVWAVVRRFDLPHSYKSFIKSCRILAGDALSVGSVREIRVISGLPASTSRERLEILDDDHHVLSFRVLGGEHRLTNYRSVTTLHDAPGGSGTLVVESYVVDVPPGNTTDDTRLFVDTIVRCNLTSLARTVHKISPAIAES